MGVGSGWNLLLHLAWGQWDPLGSWEPWSGVSCEYSCRQWIEAPTSVANKLSATGLQPLQDGNSSSLAIILGGMLLLVLPKDGGARNECC